jgi:hypothetical protein
MSRTLVDSVYRAYWCQPGWWCWRDAGMAWSAATLQSSGVCARTNFLQVFVMQLLLMLYVVMLV